MIKGNVFIRSVKLNVVFFSRHAVKYAVYLEIRALNSRKSLTDDYFIDKYFTAN